MCVKKHKEDTIKTEILREEWKWDRMRNIWCVLINSNRDPKKKPTPYLPTDFIKLSYDGKTEENKIISAKEISEEEFKRIKERYTKNGK